MLLTPSWHVQDTTLLSTLSDHAYLLTEAAAGLARKQALQLQKQVSAVVAIALARAAAAEGAYQDSFAGLGGAQPELTSEGLQQQQRNQQGQQQQQQQQQAPAEELVELWGESLSLSEALPAVGRRDASISCVIAVAKQSCCKENWP